MLDKVLKRHPREVDSAEEEDLAEEDLEEREVYVFSEKDQRRIAFRKYLEDNGIPYDEISTHSYRKGSATYTASGSTAAPPIVAICLRAGWKLGGVLNTYLSLESAADRFVGRVCTLLPQLSKKFCVMPPRFPAPSRRQRAMINEAMTGMFANYKIHGVSFAAVLRHCLASLCFHMEWLKALPKWHPFHRSYLALKPALWKKLHDMVGPLQYDGDNQDCVASGIPPWCHLALRVQKLEDIILLLSERIIAKMGKLLDDKGALTGNITREELRQTMRQVYLEGRRAGMREPRAADADESDESDEEEEMATFKTWPDGSMHRLPHKYILTCLGDATTGYGNQVRLLHPYATLTPPSYSGPNRHASLLALEPSRPGEQDLCNPILSGVGLLRA